MPINKKNSDAKRLMPKNLIWLTKKCVQMNNHLEK